LAQKPIELILLKDLVSHMGLPVTMVDASGNVVFFSEEAQELLGIHLDGTRDIPHDHLVKIYAPLDEDGRPLSSDQLPIRVALRERRPKHAQLFLHDVDGKAHRITTTAIPLDGQGGTLLGAMAFFWETDGT
jgi:PAS domain-containing protein